MDSSKLSYEMFMEIISRSSWKTLGIMRCMSKRLNALTYESYFLDLFKKRTNMVSGLIMQNTRRGWRYIREFAPSPESNPLDLTFLQDINARILATSEQGLMVYEYDKDSYRVRKPTTNQEVALPPSPNAKDTTTKVAIVVMGLKPLHYKIIRFFDSPCLRVWKKLFTPYGCDIFDSATWKWRSLKRIRLPYGVFLTNPQPLTWRGSIYMLLTNNNIIEFDAQSEKYKVFASPFRYDPGSFSNPSVKLVKYEGKLGLVCKPCNGGCEIWVFRRDEVREKIYVCQSEKRESFVTLYDSDTSVMMDYDTLMFCKFRREGRDSMISKLVLNNIPCQIFSFRSDFEPIDL